MNEQQILEIQKAMVRIQCEVIEHRFQCFERLVKDYFGDNLPLEGEWNKVEFQNDNSVIALVPANEVENCDLYNVVTKDFKYPFCRVYMDGNYFYHAPERQWDDYLKRP